MSRKDKLAKRTAKGIGKDAHKTAVLMGAFVESLNSAYGLGIPRDSVILGTVMLFGAGKRLSDYLNLLES